MPAIPNVSIIIPCFNEQTTIRSLLEAIDQQTYCRDLMEVVIADGMSTDRTRVEIAAFQAQHPELTVKVIDNPKRNIPSALNRGIAAASGEYIIRLDGHSQPQKDYVARCLAGLQAGFGANVGGVWEIRPGGKSWIARGIAAAAAHPFGVGDARYRYATEAGETDTVPFGAFRRSLALDIGGYDETLLTNEDYEFNVRIRQSGGRIWLDPNIRSAYFSRRSLRELARQYLRYGYWKGQMLRRYPRTLRWRQAVPPLFVFSLLCLGLLGWLNPLAWYALALEAGVYTAALLMTATSSALKKRDASLVLSIPLAITVMHISWGAALLWSLLLPRKIQS